ncbi:MAG: alginate lyase family protein [Opitutaceae bacterium]|nr:alginate lyase family protein [Opitutaceae bacterium]
MTPAGSAQTFSPITMTRRFIIARRILCCALVTFVAVAAHAGEPAASARPFVHPGVLHSREELTFVQQQIAAGVEPWKTAWATLRASSSASLDHRPRSRPEVVRGTKNNPNIGSSDMSADAAAVYTHALQWCLTGNAAHAQKAVEILNTWSSTLKVVSGHDTKLLIGMTGVHFCAAAELIRHTFTGWAKPDQARFEHLLREVFYPPIKDFYPSANGNWDASMIQTMLAMGIFLDDRPMFDRAVAYYLHGEGNGAIRNYFNAFGECQESGRDQAHTQMGLGFLGCAAEIAWKQGVDLYGAADNRLALGFEYTAKYNLGQEVPYEPYRSFQGRYSYPAISEISRGRFAPIYERSVYHYHGRLGLDLPFSREAAAKPRPEGRNGGVSAHLPWGALMFAGLPKDQARTPSEPIKASP